jgi:cystathionine beta-lyase/cystathionine gamma-synthase
VPLVGAPVTNPVFQTSTFFNDPGGGGEILYTRYGNNPNHLLLESRIAALEGAEACLVTSSGMAATAMALLSCVAAGDRVVAARSLYGGTRAFLDREMSRLGVDTLVANLFEDGWEESLIPGVRAVVVEIPTNPLLRVLDLPRVAERVHEAGAVLVVDATFATPVNMRPLHFGADLVVHSATKYLGGHSDVTAGAVVGSSERIAEVRNRSILFGTAPDPHTAWLVERGIKTLAVRMERHNRNGQQVAEWCEGRSGLRRVHYPGLASHPDHGIAARLLRGYGGMLALELEGGGDAATRFMKALKLARVAPSLGGVETLVSEPRYTSHAALAPAERVAIGIPDGLVRFSLGIEDADDLIADIEGALHAI